MRHGAHMQAACDVLLDISSHHRPANVALADWGRSHRFAGARDRSAIGTLVYDVLRRKRSLAAQMQDDGARALVIAAAVDALGLTPAEVINAAQDGKYAIGALSPTEIEGVHGAIPADAPDDVRADFPAWLYPEIAGVFQHRLVDQGRAMAQRAPVDLRANTLKGNRHRLMKALAKYSPVPTPHVPDGVRIAAPSAGGRPPAVERETAHGKGWFEVQDEGSQLAALLAGVRPRMQVLDLCAGAGGKTLALAAAMQNTGQIYAYDSDKSQLRPIFERMRRAGARNVQVLDAGDQAALDALGARFDVVLVDAPCSGSGTWRRKPDAKWRLSDDALRQRIQDQRDVLITASRLVKPGGHVVYVTCSLLARENQDQADWFLQHASGFELQTNSAVWRDTMGEADMLTSADGKDRGLLLTPASHNTDGFYIAKFVNRSAAD